MRLSFLNNGSGAEVLEENNYYPFGLKHEGYNALAGNALYQYKYNGKEVQTETGWSDYGWRQYMPEIGRWNGIDQLAEAYLSTSTYAYVANNPISSFDVDGRWFNRDGDIDTSGYSSGFIRPKKAFITQFLGQYSGDSGGGTTVGELLDALADKSNANSVDFSQFDFTKYGVDKEGGPGDPPTNKDVTPFGLGVEWLSGTGPRNRDFKDGDTMTEMLKKHSNVEIAREKILYNVLHGQELSGTQSYRLGGVKGVGLYLKDYSTLLTGGLTGNLAVTYLGSYDLNWTAKPNYRNHTVSVSFVVKNTSTMQSASRPPVLGYLPIWQNTAGKVINEKFEKGWGSKTTQTIIWTEILKMKRW